MFGSNVVKIELLFSKKLVIHRKPVYYPDNPEVQIKGGYTTQDSQLRRQFRE